MGGIAVLFLFVSLYFAIRKHIAISQADQFPGKVIGHESRSSSRSTSYALKIKYKNLDGIQKEFITKQATGPAAKNIGETVIVLAPKDGGTPDVLVFELLYLKYFIGITIGFFSLICFLSPTLLKVVYQK